MLRSLSIAMLIMLGACAERVTYTALPPAPMPAPVAAPRIVVPPMPAPIVAPIPAPTAAPANYANPAPSPQVSAAMLCNAAPDAAFQRPIPASGLDRALLDHAILHHTNKARCRSGLAPLTPDPSLRTVATGHSDDMVRFRFFGHTSPLPGRVTVTDRLRNGGVPFRAAAENLATVKRLEVISGQPVYPLNYQRCAYSLTPEGPRLPVRSYDSMARNLVGRWIDSPGHRENLMNPLYTRHGASGAIDPNAELCESVNATQLFAG